VFLSKQQNSKKTKSKIQRPTSKHNVIFGKKSCKTAAALGTSPLIGAKIGGRRAAAPMKVPPPLPEI